jgi:hypothetical protein
MGFILGSTANAGVSLKMGNGDNDLIVDGNTTTSDKNGTLDGGSGENTLCRGSNKLPESRRSDGLTLRRCSLHPVVEFARIQKPDASARKLGTWPVSR